MRLSYLPLILILVSSCTGKSPKKAEAIDNEPNSQNRPVKSHDENLKLISVLVTTDCQNSKSKIQQVGERLSSVEGKTEELGDSTSYHFNFQNQLLKQEVYSNNGKLKELTSFRRNSLNQLEKITSNSFIGGSPMIIKYIYNKLSQIIGERDSSEYENSYQRFTYDAKNYLIQKESFNTKDSLITITSYSYDNSGKPTCILSKSNAGDTISLDYYKYNELSQNIEHEELFTEMGRIKWYIKYNQFGDKSEEKTNNFTIHYNYEYDKNNNWTEQYYYFNEDKSPKFLMTRKIKYYK